jgi:pentatricopeptide repeat protein
MGIQSVQFFREMPSELINEVTYICVLNSCSHSGLINEARSIFDNIQLKTEKIYVSMVNEIFFFSNKI